ncbi:hypothetical protein EJ04DRAFT_513230 [Polyplosphaeria fusca]|uniref:Uncharacterized protein n=1 Tax=Polyplosphaeria fusca TaxID=682080 RepID=A0A9P4QYY9_9PLEO|nr:hypothetical protein EJ04DRAFT_513230 [Polyplosphaeria fusca]
MSPGHSNLWNISTTVSRETRETVARFLSFTVLYKEIPPHPIHMPQTRTCASAASPQQHHTIPQHCPHGGYKYEHQLLAYTARPRIPKQR